MKVGNFEVICSKCGSKKVSITEFHNDYDTGVRFKCKDCGEKTEL